MADADQSRAAGIGRQARLRRFLHLLRTKHTGPERDPLAVGIGVFIGCTPLYGLHLILSILVADLLRLNRLKVYLAANISNPLFLPFLIFAEVQTGAMLRRGHFHALTREAITAVSPWSFGLDLIVGSLALGVVLGIAMGSLTYAALGRGNTDQRFSELAGRATERYATSSITAWEFANAKLRADPVYRTALQPGMLPGGDTLLDIGCGQGLMLALLVEAEPPIYSRFVGIDTRPRVATLAAEALAGAPVEIITADASGAPLPACDAALLFDVLHMMPIAAQETLLSAVKAALRPGGVVLVREADANAGWRFALVRIGNRLKALAGRNWKQHFAFRRPDEWTACFHAHGFQVETFPGPASHPFGNTLFRLTAASGRSDDAAILNP